MGFVLRLKRADSPFFRAARRVYNLASTASLPVPSILKPIGRVLYELRSLIIFAWRRLKAFFYTQPLFSSRCESVGKRLQLAAIPTVRGHTVLRLGDDVRLGKNLTVNSGRFCDRPVLTIGNRTYVGFNVTITCNREVTIEDDVLIAGNCRISDYDGHPSGMEKRIAGVEPDREDIQPVRICKGAWIGFGALILKGVTIGEGGVVGANSVVTRDVAPHSVVAGAPARMLESESGANSESVK